MTRQRHGLGQDPEYRLVIQHLEATLARARARLTEHKVGEFGESVLRLVSVTPRGGRDPLWAGNFSAETTYFNIVSSDRILPAQPLPLTLLSAIRNTVTCLPET